MFWLFEIGKCASAEQRIESENDENEYDIYVCDKWNVFFSVICDVVFEYLDFKTKCAARSKQKQCDSRYYGATRTPCLFFFWFPYFTENDLYSSWHWTVCRSYGGIISFKTCVQIINFNEQIVDGFENSLLQISMSGLTYSCTWPSILMDSTLNFSKSKSWKQNNWILSIEIFCFKTSFIKTMTCEIGVVYTCLPRIHSNKKCIESLFSFSVCSTDSKSDGLRGMNVVELMHVCCSFTCTWIIM